MTVTLFAGCSYTHGDGFDLLSNEPNLWVNLLHSNNVHLKDTSILNVSRGGRSNEGIFQDAVYNMLHHNVKYAIVQWTSMPRYNLSLGLELYETRASFIPNTQIVPPGLNDINYSQAYLHKIRDRFTALANLHYEICNLVSYVNSLVKLAELKNTKIFFINGICPWDNCYFKILSNVLPDSYSNFTKKLLNINNRDDNEIFKLYNKIHQDYKDLGTIQSTHWLNLYSSMQNTKIDVNQDSIHPGTSSNYQYYQIFNQKINSKLSKITQ